MNLDRRGGYFSQSDLTWALLELWKHPDNKELKEEAGRTLGNLDSVGYCLASTLAYKLTVMLAQARRLFDAGAATNLPYLCQLLHKGYSKKNNLRSRDLLG